MMKTVLILVAALLALNTVLLEVDGKHQFDFKTCGGARSCFDVSRLERLRTRSGHTHKSHDELAKELDDDDDLVSRLPVPLSFWQILLPLYWLRLLYSLSPKAMRS